MIKPDMRDFSRALTALLEENDRLVKENEALKAKPTDNRPKLTDSDVKTIRQLKRGGMSTREIAEIYDVNKSTISRIIRREYHR